MSKFAIICIADATVLAKLRVELEQILDDDYQIETVESAEEGLELFRELQTQHEVAFVLMDGSLVGLQENHLLQQIHRHSPQTLNILVAGQENSAEADSAGDLAEIDDLIQTAKLHYVIAKPWQPSILRSNILAAVQRYQQTRQLEAQKAALQQTMQQLQQPQQQETLSRLYLAFVVKQAQLLQTTQTRIQALEQTNQSKADILEAIAHELRAPISNIRMATQMLEVRLRQLENGELASQCDRYCQILRTECQREVELLNDLLDLMRLDSNTDPLNLSIVQLDGWLPHVAEPFAERMRERQQQLVIDVPPDLPSLTTDLAHLERSLTELLTNAWKYTPIGETITITAQTLTHPTSGYPLAATAVSQPWLPVSPLVSRLPRSMMGISINNTGIEIPAEEHNRIFEQFYRIAHHNFWQQSGTGLGLAIVKKRVEKLHGSINVASQPVSTTFTIKLPLHPLEPNVSLEQVNLG